MKGRLDGRIGRLEPLLLVPPACAACRGWVPLVLVGDDGPHRPERCPGCRRLVPATQVCRIIGVRIADL